MAEIYAVYDDGRGICSVTEGEIRNVVPVPARAADIDCEHALRYFRRRCKGEGVVRLELRDFAGGEIYDGEKTEAVFRLTVVLRQKGYLKKISPDTQKLFRPFVAAKLTANRIKRERFRRLRNFTGICRVCAESLKNGYYTPDEATSIILEYLPSEAVVRLEAEYNSGIVGILVGISRIAEDCDSDELRRIMADYMYRLRDVIAAHGYGTEDTDDEDTCL